MFFSKKLQKFKNIKHCFFSRKNGVSKGDYKSLNCGLGSSDKKEDYCEVPNIKVEQYRPLSDDEDDKIEKKKSEVDEKDSIPLHVPEFGEKLSPRSKPEIKKPPIQVE